MFQDDEVKSEALAWMREIDKIRFHEIHPFEGKTSFRDDNMHRAQGLAPAISRRRLYLQIKDDWVFASFPVGISTVIGLF